MLTHARLHHEQCWTLGAVKDWGRSGGTRHRSEHSDRQYSRRRSQGGVTMARTTVCHAPRCQCVCGSVGRRQHVFGRFDISPKSETAGAFSRAPETVLVFILRRYLKVREGRRKGTRARQDHSRRRSSATMFYSKLFGIVLYVHVEDGHATGPPHNKCN